MFGGLMKTSSRFAIVAAAGLVMGSFGMTPAKAADLGGDCCADLEERVSELEATTARKGNRKMSLTVGGRVNRALMWYDNGVDSDVVEGDNSHGGGSLVTFSGEGTLRPGVKVGFYVAVALRPGNLEDVGDTTNVNPAHGTATLGDDEPGGDVTAVDDAQVYYSHDQLGTIYLGSQGATDGTEAVDLSGALNGKVDMSGWASDITFNGSVAVDEVFNRANGVYGYGIGYSSPTIGGFVLSASWHDDDEFGVALRWAQEYNGLRLGWAIGYSNEDGNAQAGVGNDVDELTTSGSIHHVPSGLFVTASYGTQESDNDTDLGSHWYIKGGFKKAFTDLGATNIYAEYGEASGFGESAGADLDDDGQMFGVGIEQDLDAVASVVYLNYRNWAAQDGNGVDIGEDVSSVIGGMRVNF